MLTTLILALAATLGVAGAGAHSAQPPAQPAPIAAKDAEVAAGRRALEAGRSEEALAQAEALLAGSPGHEAAAALKVEALLSLNQRQKALDAYDAWFKVSQRENPTVASLIGRAELEALKENALAAIKIDALAALARAGRADARNTLAASAAASPATPMTWPSTVAMASLGDAASQARIIQTAREASGSARAEALQAMAAGRVTGGEALLRESLASSDANLQAAAASSAADLGLKALVPDLERTAKQGDQFGRFAAALAAVRLGSQATLPLVEAGLTSPALDARLMAASAIKARGRTNWVAVARPLLENKDGLIRFQAAELLLSVDRPAAMPVLIAGSVDPNLNVRAEVARILAADADVELAQFRRLLRDGAPRVRLEAARALLQRAQSARAASPFAPLHCADPPRSDWDCPPVEKFVEKGVGVPTITGLVDCRR